MFSCLNKNLWPGKIFIAGFLIFFLDAVTSRAFESFLTNSDSIGITSFNTRTNWSGGTAPGAGTNYFTGSFGMRTPPDSLNSTFGGSSLTLSNGITSGYSLIDEGTSARTLTINNFTNGGGVIRSDGGHTFAVTLAGNKLVVTENSAVWADRNGWIITAPLMGGDGVVLTNLPNAAQAQDIISYAGTNSAFTGSWVFGAGVTKFINTNSPPGNPSLFNARQIVLNAGAVLADDVGVSLNNSNGGITLDGNATISNSLFFPRKTVISEPIAGAFALTKTGLGELTLSGSNSFSGGFTLAGNGSALNINSTNAVGTGTFTMNGPTVIINNTTGASVTNRSNNAQIWSNNFTFGGSANLHLGNGPVTLLSNCTITNLGKIIGSDVLSIGGTISGSYGLTIPIFNTGETALLASNSFSGGITIASGTMIMGHPNALGTNAVTFGFSNPTLVIATDGADYTNVISASGVTFTIASDVKTGSIGINHVLGAFQIGSSTTRIKIIKGQNVTGGVPKITASAMNLNGSDAGAVVIIPTTASITISNITAFNTNKTLQLDGTNIANNIPGIISDDGTNFITLVKTNTSTWTLAGANTYGGSTFVKSGTLAFGVGGNVISPVITISNGATLDVTAAGLSLASSQTISGNGTVIGNVTGGGVSPGASIGLLTLNGNLALNGTTIFEVNKLNGTNDQLNVSGTVTYGGTLIATNLAGTPNVGDSFTVVTAGNHSGNFNSIIGIPRPGFAWIFTNGVLWVTNSVPLNPTNITASMTGSTLLLSWPTNYLGWILQVQTNILGTGLTGNWFDVPGSDVVTSTNIFMNPANPTVFYRLRFP